MPLDRLAERAGEPRDLRLTSGSCTAMGRGFGGASALWLQRLSGARFGRFAGCFGALLHASAPALRIGHRSGSRSERPWGTGKTESAGQHRLRPLDSCTARWRSTCYRLSVRLWSLVDQQRSSPARPRLDLWARGHIPSGPCICVLLDQPNRYQGWHYRERYRSHPALGAPCHPRFFDRQFGPKPFRACWLRIQKR